MRRIIANISLVLLGLLIGTLLAEAVLRFSGFSFPTFMRYDPHAGHRLLEGAEGWYRLEGESHVRINGQGMRDDREIATRKAPGIYRVAVLGDSYAQAMQLPVEKTFWRVLEDRLNECRPFGERRIEVLNFGVEGYTTSQQIQTLRHRVWQFDPDMVLLAFFSGNDVQDNARAFATHQLRPYFVFRDDRLELDDSFRDSWSYRVRANAVWFMLLEIAQRSRVAQLAVKVRYDAARAGMRPKGHVLPHDGRPEMVGDYLNMVYLPAHQDAAWENAWRVTEGLIVQMGKEVAAKGASFLVVGLSNPIQVHPDRGQRDAYAMRLGVPDLFYPDRRIKALGERERLRVIALSEPFQKHAEENQVYLHGYANSGLGSGHWSDLGHALAGKMISEELCPARTPQRAQSAK